MNNIDWSNMTKLGLLGCAAVILSFLIFVSATRAETAECRYHKYPSGKSYIYNTQFPDGQCTLSCRYQPTYEDPDQCSHGSATNPFHSNPAENRRRNPYLNAKCTCETPLISKTIWDSGYLFCGENNDEWVYAGYPITMNLHGWQWRMNLTHSPEYVCKRG